MLITIFTPTFNRGQLLPRLYESLLAQTQNQFEWVIVDDGSTDGTQQLVSQWMEENKLQIQYVKQINAGKWKAFNHGTTLARGELFFCVDSDDCLPPDAVEKIAACWERRLPDPEIAGIIAYKVDQAGKRLGDPFPEGLDACDTYSLNQVHGCWGEWSLIYRTSVLRDNRFPDILDRFITECVVYDKIAQTHRMLLFPEPLTECEYQPGGLSSKFFELMVQNPTGFQIYYQRRIDMALGFRERIGYVVRYQGFRSMSKNKEYRYRGPHRLLVAVTRPAGVLLRFYYQAKMKD